MDGKSLEIIISLPEEHCTKRKTNIRRSGKTAPPQQEKGKERTFHFGWKTKILFKHLYT